MRESGKRELFDGRRRWTEQKFGVDGLAIEHAWTAKTRVAVIVLPDASSRIISEGCSVMPIFRVAEPTRPMLEIAAEILMIWNQCMTSWCGGDIRPNGHTA